ncbi:MAG: D-tyrosyl-tRNA(Tyr) deacylase [Bacteroidales bacterium]|nr:D-tyrosyl-tRNA(Tyr) deacylase [Bacteroidales bacterium]
MRTVIQRVGRASVNVGDETVGSIGHGMFILVGIEDTDTDEDILYLCHKIAALRIFDDSDGVMNLNVSQAKGQLLVVSQFTLMASTRKGNRPSYIRASRPETAIPMYEKFIAQLGLITGIKIETGRFGANMQIDLMADGPVTIIIDSKKRDF